MVFVGCIKIRRQHHIEQFASRVAAFFEKFAPCLAGLAAVATPVFGNGDHPPVLKLKSGHIPGIGKSMFRPDTGAVAALSAARIRARMVGFLKATAQIFLGVSVYFPQPNITRQNHWALGCNCTGAKC